MKPFTHLKKLGSLRASRSTLRQYGLYRSCALSKHMDTSLQALHEFHAYESCGQLPPGVPHFTAFCMSNGYANGKWALKLTQDQIIEDIQKGEACKAMFYSTKKMRSVFASSTIQQPYSRSSWFWDTALSAVRAAPLQVLAHNQGE